MGKNIVFGVGSWTKEEYVHVRDQLLTLKPRYTRRWMPAFLKPHIGLQLPHEYEANGMHDAAFYPLAREMEEAGFSVLPLEDTSIARESRIAEIARKVVHRELKRSELERVFCLERKSLEEVTHNPYADPQYVLAKKEHVKRYQEVLELVDMGKDHVEWHWLRANAAYEKQMLLQVDVHRPRAIVLARMHVSSLREVFERLGYRIQYL